METERTIKKPGYMQTEWEIRDYLALFHLLNKNKTIDNYSVYATFRSIFYKNNLPLDRLEDCVPEQRGCY